MILRCGPDGVDPRRRRFFAKRQRDEIDARKRKSAPKVLKVKKQEARLHCRSAPGVRLTVCRGPRLQILGDARDDVAPFTLRRLPVLDQRRIPGTVGASDQPSPARVAPVQQPGF